MATNLAERLRDSAAKCPDKTAVEYKKGGEWVKISYGELLNNVDSFLAFLKEKDVRKGDRVAIILENRADAAGVMEVDYFNAEGGVDWTQ